MSVSSDLIRTRAGLRNDLDSEEQSVENDVYSPLSFVHPLIFLHDQWSRANTAGIPVSGGTKSSHQLPVLGKGLSFTVRIGTFYIDGVRPSPSTVAMKIPNLNYSPSVKTKADTERARSVLNEIHILAHQPLRMHPNIVQLLALTWTEASSEKDSLVLMMLMPPAMLGTLADLQNEGQSLSFNLKINICNDVSQGLQALHVCGIVHGDVKSENVLIYMEEDDRMVAKVSDFGTAVVLDWTPDGTVENDPDYYLTAGTRMWMAPEASGPVKRSKLHLTDIYSFGLLAWRVLIDGANPFDDFDMPRDTEARSAKIEAIKKDFTAAHAGMAIAKIQNSTGMPETSLDSFALMWLFLRTIQCTPEERSLSAALDHGRHKDINVPNVDYFRLPPIQFNTLKMSAVSQPPLSGHVQVLMTIKNPDCVNTRRLDTTLQHQLVNAYRETLDAASEIVAEQPENSQAQSYVLQCSWVLIVLRFGSIGAWDGSLAKDVLPLAWTVLQRAKGRERRTVQSLLFSLVETSPDQEGYPNFSDIIDAAIQATLEGVFSARFFLRRYGACRDPGLSGREYFFGKDGTKAMTEETIAVLDCLNSLAGTSTNGPCRLDLKEDQYQTSKDSPLLLACQRGQTREVLALLEDGSSAAELSDIGESCLHWLYEFPEDDIEVVGNQLYAGGANPLAVAVDRTADCKLESSRHNQLGLTYKDNPLCRCVSAGSLAAVKTLTRLLQKVDLDASPKFSILYEVSVLAASLHMAEILKHVILEVESQCGSVLDSPMGEMRFEIWRTHLFRAATLVEVEIFRFSLHGKLMDEALEDTFKVLESHGNVPDLASPAIAMTREPVHPIFMAIKLGSQRVCTHIILHTRWGADPDVIEPSTGYTATFRAMQENWIDFFDALVQRGAVLDFKAQYPKGHFLADSQSTYLHLCAEMKASKYFAEELIRRGVPTGVLERDNHSALYLCLCKDSIETARVLLRHGEDLNQTDSDGFTLLGQLLRLRNRRRVNSLERAIKNVIDLAAEFGMVLNPIVHAGQQLTAFHMAAGLLFEEEQSQRVIQILLSAFPLRYVDSESTRGSYPVHEAITVNNITAFEVLQKVGADLDVKDPHGNDLLELTRVQMLGIDQDAMEGKEYAARLALRAENMLDIVENAKDWPRSSEFFRLVRKLEHELDTIVETSALIDHADSRRAQILDLVASACRSVQLVLTDWLEVYEFGRHIHRAVSPTFTLRMRCILETDGHSVLSEQDMQKIYKAYPWMVRSVSERQLSGLQQGAVKQFYYMRIRDKLRAAEEQNIPADLDKNEALFAACAKRLSGAGYPYPQVMVNYPNKLSHDWKYALEGHMDKAELPEGTFGELAAWDALQEAGSLDAIDFSSEFQALHFRPPLQKVALSATTHIRPVFKWTLYCSCVDRPFESFSEQFVANMVQRHGGGNRESAAKDDSAPGLLREADRCFHKTHYLPIEMPPMTARPGYEFEGRPRQAFLRGVEGDEYPGCDDDDVDDEGF